MIQGMKENKCDKLHIWQWGTKIIWLFQWMWKNIRQNFMIIFQQISDRWNLRHYEVQNASQYHTQWRKESFSVRSRIRQWFFFSTFNIVLSPGHRNQARERSKRHSNGKGTSLKILHFEMKLFYNIENLKDATKQPVRFNRQIQTL